MGGSVPRARRPRIPGPVQDVASVLDPVLREHPERAALIDVHGRLSFAELDAQVNRAAHVLGALGVRMGERVAASAPNSAALIVAFLASQRLGAVWVGINRPLAAPEKRFLLQDCGAQVFLGDAEMVDQIAACEPSLCTLVMDPGDPSRDQWSARLAEAQSERIPADIDPFAPAAIAYTSGTTGFPKGAVHSQHNLVLLGAVARECGFYPRDMPHGVMLPLTTLNLMVLVPLHTLQSGAPCVVMDRPRPEQLADWVERERIGHFTAVPTLYHDLLRRPELDPRALASLDRPEMGGAHIPPAVRELYRKRVGKDLCVGYGMTEAPSTVTRTGPDDAFEPGLVGRALPQYRLEIRSERDVPLPVGEVGEVVLAEATQGPFAHVWTPMLGYWGQPAASEAAVRDGRYYTGDLGRLDESGQLFILGRRKEMIVRGGANVYPAEVERVLHDAPQVAAAAVVGEPDSRLGERVVAYLELSAEAAFDESALRAHCEAQLARYKVPVRFEVVERLPRNAMGKVLKAELTAAR